MEFVENILSEEFASLEKELCELESDLFDKESLDPITIDRVDKRKEWLKDRLDTLRAELYPEVVA